MASKLRPLTTHLPTLLIEMKKGKEAAWEEFHSRFCEFIFHASLGLNNGCPVTAQDVAQETLCRAVRYLNTKLCEEEEVRRWLYCLIRTSSIDLARGKKTRFKYMEKYKIRKELEMMPEGLLLIESPEEKVNSLLSQLKSDEAELIRDFYFKEMSYNAIAEKYASTSKAIESKLARTRTKLRSLTH